MKTSGTRSLSDPLREARPYVALAALVAGVLTGEHLGPGAGTGALAVVATCTLVGVLAQGRALRSATVAVAIAMAGVALTQRALDGVVDWPLAAAADRGADATIDATLVEDPDGTRFLTRVLARTGRARVEHGRWRDTGGRTVLVVADGAAAQRLALLDAGDHVRLDGWFRPLEGYDERYRWRHAVARFDASTLLEFSPPTGVLWQIANPVRATVLRGTASLPATERALVAGFLLGDTRDLPQPVLERFRAAGLSHLLAVSGANVAFVLALVGPVLRRAPRNARVLFALGVLAVFGAMTRWEPSVLRACAMATCAVLAVHVGRPARALRTLALAAVVLLAIDPFLLHSVGFLLSCGASLGIALLAPPLAARLPGPTWLRESLATTTAAQIGVAPVLLPVFGSLPLVAVPANLLAVPLAAPLTTWGLASGAVGGVLERVVPGVAHAVQVPTRVLADGVIGIADAAGRIPITVDPPSAVAIAAVFVLAFCARRGRMLRRDAMVVPPR